MRNFAALYMRVGLSDLCIENRGGGVVREPRAREAKVGRPSTSALTTLCILMGRVSTPWVGAGAIHYSEWVGMDYERGQLRVTIIIVIKHDYYCNYCPHIYSLIHCVTGDVGYIC